MTKVVSLDFELCGVLNLKEVGADVWTKAPTTLPIVAAFALDHDEPRCIEFEPFDHTSRLSSSTATGALLHAIDEGAEIHAWNAYFELRSGIIFACPVSVGPHSPSNGSTARWRQPRAPVFRCRSTTRPGPSTRPT